jgi:hypothetical protein
MVASSEGGWRREGAVTLCSLMICGLVQCSSCFVCGSDRIMEGEMRILQCFGRKRELGKCRSRWQDDITVDSKGISCAVCTCLVWFMTWVGGRALVNEVTNIQRL